MSALRSLGIQFAGTYHVTNDPAEYGTGHGQAEWLAQGRGKPLRWARQEPVEMTAAMRQEHQQGRIPTVHVGDDETPTQVWTGHPSERPEGWLQVELPR